MGRLTENTVLVIKNKSHAVTAEVAVPDDGAEGVIIAQGGAFGGWSLYAQGRPPDLLLQPARPAAVQGRWRPSDPGRRHQVRMEFAYDGGGLGKGGNVTLYIDGAKVGEGRVDATHADDLLRRTRRPTSAPTAAPRSATTTAATTRLHRHGSTGSRSTSTRTPRTPTTSSRRRSAAGRDGAPVTVGGLEGEGRSPCCAPSGEAGSHGRGEQVESGGRGPDRQRAC